MPNKKRIKKRTGEGKKSALKRREQHALQESEVLSEIILTSLEINIAVLNKDGTIIAVNEAWRRFGRENSAASQSGIGAGFNYIDVCRQAAEQGSVDAENALAGITSVLEGAMPYFEFKFPCHSPAQTRWFLMSVMPIKGNSEGVVITHKNITELHQVEAALQQALSNIVQLKERLEAECTYLREEVNVKYGHEEIVGHSDEMKKVLSRVEQVAVTDSTVLILGETGTGKELIARAIHNLSSRCQRPMIKVNCAALPPTLIESELFGREKGAYTGALSRQIGRFEVADGSTIFLDEIGELPMELQPKLLRVIEESQFERLGSTKTISTDVRVIAATNRDLAEEVNAGRFRQDLYYRINVFPLTVPPLRDRREDIPLLVWAFVKEFENSMGRSIEKIPLRNMNALQHYPWPGNVRELSNIVENAMIINQGKILEIQSPAASPTNGIAGFKIEDVEREHIMKVLKNARWRVYGNNGAAELLGLKPSTLQHRMTKLGIIRPSQSEKLI